MAPETELKQVSAAPREGGFPGRATPREDELPLSLELCKECWLPSIKEVTYGILTLGRNNSYSLCCLFYVSGIELGMSFTLFLALTTPPHDIYDPISQISQTEVQE